MLGKHTMLVLYAVLIIISFHSSDKIEGLLFYRRIHKPCIEAVQSADLLSCAPRSPREIALRLWSTLTGASYGLAAGITTRMLFTAQ